ncbi:MAG: 50S ribosomal protein L20 [Candidatus Gracilibacteria bacterium]|nr:50S ribosomal protein L20 [Candidatus Gracilibacteria bacterium]
MVRVKRGLMTKKRHSKILKACKGYRMLRSRSFTNAKNAWMKAGTNAYIGRRRKKRDFRRLWNVRINIASRESGLSYSKFINALYKKSVKLNRKVLSNLAISNPQVFAGVVEFVK